MNFVNWIKREYIIDSILTNAVLNLYCFMFVPHALALVSVLAVAS